MLAARLRLILLDQARRGETITYRALAERLGLTPPGIIRQVTDALESLMQDDAAAGRPLLAALAVSRGPDQQPGRGFFLKAQELGCLMNAEDPAATAGFHAGELARLHKEYSAAAETD